MQIFCRLLPLLLAAPAYAAEPGREVGHVIQFLQLPAVPPEYVAAVAAVRALRAVHVAYRRPTSWLVMLLRYRRTARPLHTPRAPPDPGFHFLISPSLCSLFLRSAPSAVSQQLLLLLMLPSSL